ncbi:hypothetical protein JOM56_015064 [Amanita muscaria]
MHRQRGEGHRSRRWELEPIRYEETVKKNQVGETGEGKERQAEEVAECSETRGRKRNVRSEYMSGHPNPNKIQVVRSDNHNTLPNFVGPWIPREDDPETRQYYSCVMLALLKPWRTLKDLTGGSSSWAEALEEYLQKPSSMFARRFKENVQFYHNCKEAARREEGDPLGGSPAKQAFVDAGGESETDEGEEQGDAHDTQERADSFWEGDIETYLRTKESSREQRHGDQAVKIAIEAGIFGEEGTSWPVDQDVLSKSNGEHGSAHPRKTHSRRVPNRRAV